MASSLIRELKSTDFDSEVLQSTKPVILDFYGDHCGSCKALLPILESLARERGAELNVFSVDVGQSPELAARFNVRSIPTLLFFREGELKHTHVGMLSAHGMLGKLSA